jgi:hypothetical protein
LWRKLRDPSRASRGLFACLGFLVLLGGERRAKIPQKRRPLKAQHRANRGRNQHRARPRHVIALARRKRQGSTREALHQRLFFSPGDTFSRAIAMNTKPTRRKTAPPEDGANTEKTAQAGRISRKTAR